MLTSQITKLENVTPVLARDNVFDPAQAEAVSSAEFPRSDLRVEASDLSNVGLSHLCTTRVHAAPDGVAGFEQPLLHRVLDIPARRDPFKIHRHVVHLDAVDVVDLRLVASPLNKCLSYETVNGPGPACSKPSPIQADARVVIRGDVLAEKGAGARASGGTDATYSPQVTDAVEALVPDDVSPCFTRQVRRGRGPSGLPFLSQVSQATRLALRFVAAIKGADGLVLTAPRTTFHP